MKPILLQGSYTADDATALLASKSFIYAECYTITPLTGDPMRFTNAAEDVNVTPTDGSTTGIVPFYARQVTLSGLKYKTSVGTDVDEQQLKIGYTPGSLNWQGILTFPQAAQLGRLDGAVIRRDRYFAPTWGAPWVFGTVMFAGRVSTLTQVGALSSTISVKSDMVLLNVQAPRALWLAQCIHSWGDTGCGITVSEYTENVTVGSGATTTVIPWSGITSAFVMGKIIIEGSDNVNRQRTILSVNAGVSATLIYPLDFVPAAGTPVSFYPNCQRLYANCYWGVKGGGTDAIAAEHFMGFPWIPVSETAY